jgi:hypothetical protein
MRQIYRCLQSDAADLGGDSNPAEANLDEIPARRRGNRRRPRDYGAGLGAAKPKQPAAGSHSGTAGRTDGTARADRTAGPAGASGASASAAATDGDHRTANARKGRQGLTTPASLRAQHAAQMAACPQLAVGP